MALVECIECGKSVSDKAVSCPGCGCPVNAFDVQQSTKNTNYRRSSKEELWRNAYDLQYKSGKADHPGAIEIYKHIIAKFKDSDEAKYAQDQLALLSANSQSGSYVAPIDIRFTASQLNRLEIMAPEKIWSDACRFQQKADPEGSAKAIQLYSILAAKYPKTSEGQRASEHLKVRNENIRSRFNRNEYDSYFEVLGIGKSDDIKGSGCAFR